MVRVTLVLNIALLFFLAESHGQENSFYLKTSYGVGLSNIKKHTVLDNRYEEIMANSFAIGFGFYLRNNLAISSGVSVEQRGGQFNSFGREILGERLPLMLGDTIILHKKNEFAYLYLPLQFQYYQQIGKKLNAKIALGGYYGFLIGQIWDFERATVFTLIEGGTIQFDYSDRDIGISMGVGFDYRFYRFLSLYLECSTQRGLVDIFEDEEIKGFHIRNSFSLGVKLIIP